MAIVFSVRQRPWQIALQFPFIQGLETMIDEYDSMDKPMVSQMEMKEDLDLEQGIPPPPYEDVDEEVQEDDDEEKTKRIYNVPYMRTAYSPRVGKRGGAMDRIMKREEQEIWQKRRFGSPSPWIGQASNNLLARDKYEDLSMSKALSPFWLPISSMGAARLAPARDPVWYTLPRGKKSSKRDWTRISKRGRETEGSWHPYKRDPIYR